MSFLLNDFLKYPLRYTRALKDVARTLERFFRTTNFYEIVCYMGLALRDYHARSSFRTPRTIDSRILTILRVGVR